jgi:hypothetical protein
MFARAAPRQRATATTTTTELLGRKPARVKLFVVEKTFCSSQQ